MYLIIFRPSGFAVSIQDSHSHYIEKSRKQYNTAWFALHVIFIILPIDSKTLYSIISSGRFKPDFGEDLIT